jgi:hypothetical protein
MQSCGETEGTNNREDAKLMAGPTIILSKKFACMTNPSPCTPKTAPCKAKLESETVCMRSIDHEELNINHAENPDDLF